MKNNKGFSIVELIVSFSICMAVVIVLFQIVVVLKEVYEKSEVQTSLLNKQNILVDLIYSDILEKGLNNVKTCEGNSYCATFCYDSTCSDFKNLSYIVSNSTIEYGDYITPTISGSTIGTVGITTENNVVSVKMPVTHKLFSDQSFDIKIVHYLES